MSVLSRLKQVNAKQPPEESVALRVAVMVSVLAAALGLLSQGVGSPGLRAGVIVGIPTAFWFSWWARHQEGFWVKVALAVAVLVAFASFLSSVRSVQAGNFADLQIPLAELFLWVQLLHAFDVPARRDLLFSLVSSFILMGVAGVLSISMDLVPFLVVWAVAAATSLVLAHRSEMAGLPALGAGRGRSGAGGRSVEARVRQGAQVAGPVAMVVVLVVVVGIGAFYLAPPAGQARAITFPSHLASSVPLPNPGSLVNPSLGNGGPASGSSSAGRGGRASFGYVGFSTSLDTGNRGRPDNTLVMRVRANRPDFWRGQTFDTWDGRTWSVADEKPVTLTGSSPLPIPPSIGEPASLQSPAELVQTFYVRTPGPNLIFGAGFPTRLYFPDRRVFQLSDGTLRAGVPLGRESVYTVVSARNGVTADALRAAATGEPTDFPPDIATRYVRPLVTTPRVRELAASITAPAATEYDKVLAIEGWLAAHTTYTLNIPPLPDGADAVDHFLFDERRGFCEQIGTSLVVMLRSVGIPARLVTGYTPGERNPFTGLYEVRAKDAHAWAEVWFPGVGWQGFDPTASVPLAGDASSSSASNGLVSYLSHRLPHPPGAVLVAFGGLAVLAIAVVAGGRAWRKLVRFLRRPAPSWTESCQSRLEQVGAARGRPRRESETMREYAAALGRGPLPDPRLPQLADIVTRASFGPVPATLDERALVERVLTEAAAARR